MKKKPKAKKYAEGGLAGIAEEANSLMDQVNNMSKSINYGGDTAPGSTSYGDFGKDSYLSFGSGRLEPAVVKPNYAGGAMPKMSSALAALGQKPLGMKKGGKVKSASARADGCAVRGKTRA